MDYIITFIIGAILGGYAVWKYKSVVQADAAKAKTEVQNLEKKL